MNIEALLARYFHRSISPRTVISLKGDASNRRYHRVLLDAAAAGGISSLIVMELPQDAKKSDEASSGVTEGELPFVDVARHLTATGIRVPRIYLDATSDGALLLEDLGDRLLVDCVRGADEDTVKSWYEAAAALLASMHDKMDPIPKTSIASKRCFDTALLRWELDHYREWGIEACHGISPNPEARTALDRAFDAFSKELADLPQGFVHRDYQSRNLMVLEPAPRMESLAVIDFQDAFLGPRVYDLVALLNDSYVDLSPMLKQHIIRYYATLRAIDPEVLSAEFHLVTVHRKLKDGGRFVFIDRVKHNPSFLPFVEKSFARARASLAAVQGHDTLKSALADADPKRFAKRHGT